MIRKRVTAVSLCQIHTVYYLFNTTAALSSKIGFRKVHLCNLCLLFVLTRVGIGDRETRTWLVGVSEDSLMLLSFSSFASYCLLDQATAVAKINMSPAFPKQEKKEYTFPFRVIQYFYLVFLPRPCKERHKLI